MSDVKCILHPPAVFISAWTHSNDVKKVIISKSVQYGGDSLPGDGQPEAFHAATHIHQNDHVLWRGGSLNVPLPVAAVEGNDPMFIWLPLDPLKTEFFYFTSRKTVELKGNTSELYKCVLCWIITL